MISNPIPSGQIVDINVDFDCLEEPQCVTLNNTLQSIIDGTCSKLSYDSGISNFEFNECFSSPTPSGETATLEELIQKMIDEVTDLKCPEGSSSPDFDISNLNFCDGDDWYCGVENNCVVPVDDSNNPILEDYTIKQVLQGLVRRINSLETQLCNLTNDFGFFSNVVFGSLDTRVTTIEDNCCNLGLSAQVNALVNTTIPAINTNITTINNNINTINTTLDGCCPP